MSFASQLHQEHPIHQGQLQHSWQADTYQGLTNYQGPGHSTTELCIDELILSRRLVN